MLDVHGLQDEDDPQPSGAQPAEYIEQPAPTAMDRREWTGVADDDRGGGAGRRWSRVSLAVRGGRRPRHQTHRARTDGAPIGDREEDGGGETAMRASAFVSRLLWLIDGVAPGERGTAFSEGV